MRYAYDDYGWYSGETCSESRSTVTPPNYTGDRIVGELFPNYTGVEWVLVPYYAPPAPDTREIRRAEILAELAQIDAETTKPRTMRELALNIQATIDWVTAQNNRANLLREELINL